METAVTTAVTEVSFLQSKLETVGEKIVTAALIFIVGLIAYEIVVMLISKFINRTRLDKIVANYLIICVKALLMITLVVIVLSALGVSVVSLVALLSAAAAAVALALQNSLSNLAAGILIIVNKPFVAGDFIESASVTGVVDEIHLFNCRLHTLDNKFVVIPNNTLIGGVIVNYSYADKRRVDLKVAISYAGDIDKTRAVLLKIAEDTPLALADPAPFVGVASHGDSAVVLDYRVWCATDNYWPTFYYLQEEVLRRFAAENIEIPYPQLDVHFDKQEA